jgi:ferric-dicitrate binding protein FerR (iron transport regulator)
MSTRKQRRRRAKEHRHEYVWEDAEGNELDSPVATSTKPQSRPNAAPARSAREPQAPSWRRSLKRGAIFAPIMLAVVVLISTDQTLSQQIRQTAVIVVIFVPFSYFLDSVFYRNYKRRLARREQADGRRRS